MRILFLSIGDVSSLRMEEHGVYTDLVRKLYQAGNEVYVVTHREKRSGLDTELCVEAGITVLRVRTGNITKTNVIEKGITTLQIGRKFESAIKRYLKGIHFEMVLYTTPPITLTSVIKWTKKKYNARTYLMLKDIFPQNAVDMGILHTNGRKAFLYDYFRRQEKRLYRFSDRIGCMSQANVDYVIKHNPEVDPDKVEIFPNTLEIQDLRLKETECKKMRQKFNLPQEKKIFVYGGNLGRPQGIPFLIECLKAQRTLKNSFFLIAGSGTEYPKLEKFIRDYRPANVKLMKHIPKKDYDRLVAACDVGLIFLDHRFTIPNFPSRLLSYMQAGLPVLACTDPNTDIGKVITEGRFGWWCESNDVKAFTGLVKKISKMDVKDMGNIGYEYLQDHYNVEDSYKIIKNFKAGD